MKKISLVALFAATLSLAANAQKFAYVDTEYILNNIPAYKAAKDQLDKLSAAWQKEIDDKRAEVEKLYKDYQSQKVLLNEDMQLKREEEIINKEKEVKELQKKYFGKDGTLFKKREELVKPIQDEIFNKIKEIAVEGNYSVIFDTSAGLSMLYTDPKYDKSDEVLEKLGYKN